MGVSPKELCCGNCKGMTFYLFICSNEQRIIARCTKCPGETVVYPVMAKSNAIGSPGMFSVVEREDEGV